MPDWWKKKISKAHKGKKFTKEHKRKLSVAKLGTKRSEETKKKISDGHKGEKAYQWKGDDVGYRALHHWVQKQLGTPRFCEECGNRSLEHRQYHWSNISGKYKRKLTDWRRLCVKCHLTLDHQAKKQNRGTK